MMKLSLTGNIDLAPQLLNHLEKKALPIAQRRALSKTLRSLQSDVKKQLSTQYKLPQKVIKRRLKSTAHYQQGQVRLWIGLNAIKAIYIGNARQTRRGVRVGKHHVDGAFLATMKSGHQGVYKRKGRARFPIKEMTVTLKDSKKQLTTLATNNTLPRFQQLLRHELEFAMSQQR